MDTIENIDIKIGLSKSQVQKRIEENKVNHDVSVPTKSIKRILFENFVTLFNILNLFLAILIFSVGSYKNMLFLMIVIINTAISTIQEIHSKRVVDKLSLLATSKAKVIRDRERQEISIYNIVLDDIIEYEAGNQIPTDSIICDGEVEIDESFITGESDSITKVKGENILSGSIILSGKCVARVTNVGEDNYTAKISSGAKYVKKVKSEIMTSLNKIIKMLTFAIIPIGIILFCNQYFNLQMEYKEAIVKTVAAIIGMIPEGLVLLTSTVLAVSVIRLSKNKVLVQELYGIETLAKVDTLCLDKTGTLTEGKMEVKKYVSIKDEEIVDDRDLENILGNISKSSNDSNTTITAIKEFFTKIDEEWELIHNIPFSSKTKWSGVSFKDKGTYIIGAPDILIQDEKQLDLIKEDVKEYRIISVMHSNQNIQDKELPNELELVGFVYILDKIRKEAKETLEYFKKQDVDIKIISGDNPITVSQIAKHVGIDDYNKYIDMSTIKKEEEIKDIVLKYKIFGRVTPIQKKNIIIALKEQGRTVAMTGDGVNDVLALKEADTSIAMGNSSDAAKNVSQLMLLDSNFSSMPKVVAEGRRTINNIERSASLFLVKTIYSTILAILFIFVSEEYPFMPIQLSLISMVTIGIPSFILALEPNKERIHGNFLRNVVKNALPTALTVIISVISIAIGLKYERIQEEIYPSLCVMATGFSAILLLFTLCRARKSEHKKMPISKFRLFLSINMLVLFCIGLIYFDWWFSIEPINNMINEIIKILVICLINFTVLNLILRKIDTKKD